MQNKFKILDETGDRKYFTIIPNYIVNHSTPYEQAIYLFMKRVAGENGTCWTSAQEIARKLECSRNTISKYRDKLVKRGWIELVGKRGRTKPTDEYRIVDLWKLNTDHYQSKKESSTIEQSPKKVEKKVQLVNLESSTGVHKEEPIYKNNKYGDEQSSSHSTFEEWMGSRGYKQDSLVTDDGETYHFWLNQDDNKIKPSEVNRLLKEFNRSQAARRASVTRRNTLQKAQNFDYKHELRKLKEKGGYHLFLAYVWHIKAYDFKNYPQFQAALKRDLVFARQMDGYTLEQITAAVTLAREEAEKLDYDWKVSTVVKKLR